MNACTRCKKMKIPEGMGTRCPDCRAYDRSPRNVDRRKMSLNTKVYKYKQSAIKRNLEWSITDEYAHSLFVKACFYCGKDSQDTLNGIDRIINTDGYIISNCVPCCAFCNMAKRDLTVIDFLSSCRRVCDFQNTNVEPVTTTHT
jgi:hypothetical protein